MGYRSEVAYAIVFRTKEDRDAIIGRLTPAQQQIIRDEVQLLADRILFHDPAIKWYTTREMGAYNLPGFANVDAHDALLQAAEEAEYTDSDDVEDSNGVYSMGIFIRLGEEDDDTEKNSWGQYNAPEGFPNLYDLVDYRRELTVGW